MAGGGVRERAEVLYELDRYDQAAALLAQHLAQHPGDSDALVLLARCRRHLHDLHGAMALLDEALRGDPELLTAWVVRADVLLALRAYPDAEFAAHRAVELAPQFWGGHHLLAMVWDATAENFGNPAWKRARRAQAHQAALHAVSLGPQEASAHFLVGLTAHRMKNLAVARQAYETTLRLDPENSEAHNNLALLHLRGRWFTRGAWTRAAEGFVDSAAHDLNDREARFNLETMAWGVAAGARWVALAGFFTAMIATAGLRTGQRGSGPVVGELVGAGLALAFWGAWFLWQRRRVAPRLRRPLMLVARACPPVIAMAVAVGAVALYTVVAFALPYADAGLIGGLGAPVFWGLVLTYWISRAALRRRLSARR
ncbi:tetratricopeptide repeat protein [Streptomyces sp. NPDC001941]|uniref:tetratricopeptide repeat protein n=1 Tax=Streptomyces sp. NPDC001941 TaxID=3154659 RepID=UPI0033171018